MSDTILDSPQEARALLVLAHGAGAGMKHPFMAAVAKGLAERGVATLRYEFEYMAKGTKRPDPPRVAQARVREAVAQAARRMPGVPLFAGGKSFGGRMTSQAQAESPLEGVRGLIFFGFPLHAAGKPSADRARHLAEVKVPMLFLQGSRDALASLELLTPVVKKLGTRAMLEVVEAADHSFHAPAKSARSDADVLAAILDAASAWMVRAAHPLPRGRDPG